VFHAHLRPGAARRYRRAPNSRISEVGSHHPALDSSEQAHLSLDKAHDWPGDSRHLTLPVVYNALSGPHLEAVS